MGSCGCNSCLTGKHGKKLKIRASIMAALLFIVIASPEVFGFMQKILGGLVRVASPAGVPTAAGLVLHGLVYGLITYGLMYKKNKY